MKNTKKEALSRFHRGEILAAAEQLFSEKGIEKTTMDDIARTADYSKATIYVYFKNKDEIVSGIQLKSMLLLKEHIRSAIGESADVAEQYYAICRQLARYREDYPLCFDAVLGEIPVDLNNPQTPPVFREIYQAGEEINQLIGDMIKAGMAQGLFRQDLPIPQTTLIFWASLCGLIRMAGCKEDYICQFTGSGKEEFLRCGFETLLRSVLKGEDS